MSKPRRRKELSKRRSRFDENAQKLSSSGEASINFLAAGVAHEFNNLLGAAHGHAAWALSSGKLEDMRSALEVISMVCERSSSITKALQNFAQPKEEKFESCDLSEIIQQAVTIEEADIHRANASIELNLSSVRAEVNSSEIIEVCLNLIRNSLDAFSENQTKDPKIRFSLERKGSLVEITYSDNGPGIESSFKDSIFHAFWTTKGVLKNIHSEDGSSVTPAPYGSAGLGLFLSRKIIQEHGGNLTILDSQDPGANFLISIPILNAD